MFFDRSLSSSPFRIYHLSPILSYSVPFLLSAELQLRTGGVYLYFGSNGALHLSQRYTPSLSGPSAIGTMLGHLAQNQSPFDLGQ
jgi:hypothetical protein